MTWDSFRISGEKDKYKLWSNGFNPGATGLKDLFEEFNGIKFSTSDQDNDEFNRNGENLNCAQIHGGTGWWLKYCYESHLNQYYGPHWRPNTYQESVMVLKGT